MSNAKPFTPPQRANLMQAMEAGAPVWIDLPMIRNYEATVVELETALAEMTRERDSALGRVEELEKITAPARAWSMP